MHVVDMTKAANDNSNTWTSIGLQTNLILNRLRSDAQLRELVKCDEQEQKQSDGNAGSGSEEKQQTKEYAEYVETRLRELAMFERRASGFDDRTTRKRK